MKAITFTLAPYSYYLLYISIVAVVVFLIILLKHLLVLGRQMNETLPILEKMNKKSETINAKLERLPSPQEPEESQKKILTVTKLLQIYGITKAIRKYYKLSEEKGFKQIGKSTYSVLQERSLKKRITEKAKQIFN